MPMIHPGSVTTILQSTAESTTKTGDWYQIHPNASRIAWQAVLTVSSAGATAGSTVYVEVANTTAVAVATKASSFVITATTDTVSDGGVFATTMLGAWKFMRVNMQSLSSSTAGSAGSPQLTVYVSAGSER